MAGSTIKGSFSGVGWAYPEIVWSSSSNVASNSSSVTAILYFVRTAAYNSYNLDGHTVTMNVNGSASASRPFSLNTSRVEVWRRTVSVPHNSDGTKSITIGASSSGTGNSLGSYNFSATATLDKIPRAFDFIVSSHTVEMGTLCTVKVNNNGSGFQPWLYLNFGGKRVGYGQIPVGSNFNFTPSVADFAPQIPNDTSGWGGLEVETWNGNTFIGRYKISPFTLTLPSSVQPSLTSLTASDEITNVPTVMESKTIWVQSLSSIRFSANGVKGGVGANITKYTFSLGTVWSSDHNGPLYDLKLFNFMNFSGSYTAKVVVTDTRGRTASKTMEVNILPYNKPNLSITASRNATTPTNVVITPTGSVSSLKNGTTEKNPYSIKMEYKLATATTWTAVPNGTVSSFTAVTLSNTATDKSYNIRITLADKFNTIISTQNISTATVLLDLFKDVGVGVGKLYEDGHGTLDVEGNIYLNGKSLLNMFYPIGTIYQSTNSANPSTFMGGTWERFSAGRVLVGVYESDPDFSTANKYGGSKTQGLAALIGAYNNMLGSLSYKAIGPVNGDTRNFALTNMTSNPVSSIKGINHSTRVTQHPSGDAPTTIQPYITAYMWRRTA